MAHTDSEYGFLALADISGYEAYISGTEFDHDREIIVDLLEFLVQRLHPVLALVQIETDAVFAYFPQHGLLGYAPMFVRKREWKEPVAIAAGWQGYAVFTEEFHARLELELECLHAVKFADSPPAVVWEWLNDPQNRNLWWESFTRWMARPVCGFVAGFHGLELKRLKRLLAN